MQLRKANKKIADLLEDIRRLSEELRKKETLLTGFMEESRRLMSMSAAKQIQMRRRWTQPQPLHLQLQPLLRLQFLSPQQRSCSAEDGRPRSCSRHCYSLSSCSSFYSCRRGLCRRSCHCSYHQHRSCHQHRSRNRRSRCRCCSNGCSPRCPGPSCPRGPCPGCPGPRCPSPRCPNCPSLICPNCPSSRCPICLNCPSSRSPAAPRKMPPFPRNANDTTEASRNRKTEAPAI